MSYLYDNNLFIYLGVFILISSLVVLLPFINETEVVSLSLDNNYQIRFFNKKGQKEVINYDIPIYDTKYSFTDDKKPQAEIIYKTSFINLLTERPRKIDKIIVTLPKDMQDKILNEDTTNDCFIFK